VSPRRLSADEVIAIQHRWPSESIEDLADAFEQSPDEIRAALDLLAPASEPASEPAPAPAPPPRPRAPLLSSAEIAQILELRAQRRTLAEIARELGRSATTISHALARHAR
jgi:DNA-binding NarL/FixJ family response regulator